MNIWNSLVDAVTALILTTGAHLGGSPGLGIFVTAFVVRALAIPVLLPLAIRTRDRQRIVRHIRPRIKAINKEYKGDPGKLSRELERVHAEHGIKVMDWPGAFAALIQVAILIAFFQAVLHVSEEQALTSGGLLLGAVAAALSVLGTKLSGQSEGATWVLWMAGLLPLAISVWLGTGVGLYLTAFYAASLLQALLMGRRKPVALPAHGTLPGNLPSQDAPGDPDAAV